MQQAAVVDNFDFSAALSTFTAGMAKRAASGPFAAAPIVQGKWNTSAATDEVSCVRGSQILGHFYETFDTYQGSIVFWITPEWDGDDGQSHYIFMSGTSTGNIFVSKTETNFLQVVSFGLGAYAQLDISAWVAGNTYCVVARWDSKVSLDGINYGSISINDIHSYSTSPPYATVAPSNTIFLGYRSGTYIAADSIIEGFTVYRRPLYDSTYGIDVGNGDEINLIYAAGAGKDPTEITGSWDVCFCLPTDSSAGALATGTGEAWSHPHSNNVLTDGFCQTTYGSSGWSTKNTPSTAPADLADADKIFAWGYDWTCDANAEGIEQSLTSLAAGQDYVLRCLAHVNDANDLRIRITDDTNSADIVTYEFGASSDRDTPGVAIITFELPTAARNGVGSDCVAITIAVEGTAASQQVYLHQFELLENLVDNPSLETGSGDPWIPDGWTNAGLEAGDSEQELTIVRSGSSSVQYNASALNEGLNTSSSLDFSGHCMVGFSNYVTVADQWSRLYDRAFAYLQSNSALGQAMIQPSSTTTGNWFTNWRVGIASNLFKPYINSIKFNGNGQVQYVDDVYVFALDAVSLTVTPASEANSTETSGLRVDGLDIMTQPITELAATLGNMRLAYTPRHDAADAVKFGTASNEAMIAEFYGAADNYIRLYWSAANTITLAFNDGGGEHTDNWNATGAIEAGTKYELVIDYTAAAMTLKVGGVVKITITTALSFATTPTIVYWGQAQAGTKQADATFAAPA
ncbi:hypothetical protein LCGC14_0387240 [marine sediment metagenome]|uniref:Uncharacterized protein n=1 Tax=marine sediment metagenome TaxID=412755 RepID=A0A0F9VMZ4_9ZZZZ